MLCRRVPWGNIESFSNDGASSYLRWAPGDCTAYDLIVSKIGDTACGYIGGDHVVTARIGYRWLSAPLSLDDLGCVYADTLHEQMFGHQKEVDLTSNYSLLIYAILLNYACFEDKYSLEYVEELKNHELIKSRFGF